MVLSDLMRSAPDQMRQVRGTGEGRHLEIEKGSYAQGLRVCSAGDHRRGSRMYRTMRSLQGRGVMPCIADAG